MNFCERSLPPDSLFVVWLSFLVEQKPYDDVEEVLLDSEDGAEEVEELEAGEDEDSDESEEEGEEAEDSEEDEEGEEMEVVEDEELLDDGGH